MGNNSDLLLMNFYYVSLILSTFCNANKLDEVHLRLNSTDFTQAGLLLFYQKFTVISNKNVLNLTIKCQKHLTRTTVDLSTRSRILCCFFILHGLAEEIFVSDENIAFYFKITNFLFWWKNMTLNQPYTQYGVWILYMVFYDDAKQNNHNANFSMCKMFGEIWCTRDLNIDLLRMQDNIKINPRAQLSPVIFPRVVSEKDPNKKV